MTAARQQLNVDARRSGRLAGPFWARA